MRPQAFRPILFCFRSIPRPHQIVALCPFVQGHRRESRSILHWVLGVTVHPTLGPGVSWPVLHWLRKSRGPSCTWSWGIVVHSTLGSGGVAAYPTLAPGGSWSILTGFWKEPSVHYTLGSGGLVYHPGGSWGVMGPEEIRRASCAWF